MKEELLNHSTDGASITRETIRFDSPADPVYLFKYRRVGGSGAHTFGVENVLKKLKEEATALKGEIGCEFRARRGGAAVHIGDDRKS